MRDNEATSDAPSPSLGDRQIVAIRDVIVCASEHDNTVTREEFRGHPPVGMTPRPLYENSVPEVHLGGNIKLTQVPRAEAEQIMDACTPAGHNFEPIRQFGQRYAFVREYSVEEVVDDLFGFDDGGELGETLALSRLIRDNGFSYQYAARVIEHADGTPTIRYLDATEGHAVYRLHPGREWLDAPEAEEFALLLEAYRSAELPPRVREALWRSEYATHMRRGDIMLATIVSGLEALLKVGRGNLTRQFRKRVSALARELKIEGIDEALCDRVYDARSDWVHAGLDGGPSSEEEEQRWIKDTASMRDLLRAACRKAIEDSGFRSVFVDGAAIKRRWPVPAPERRRRTIAQRIRILLRG